MTKRFKQVSTGLVLSCSREDVIAQYEKYPEAYIPLPERVVAQPKANVKPAKKSGKK